MAERDESNERRGVPRMVPMDPIALGWLSRATLEQWRAAEAVLQRQAGAPEALPYERAVAIALGHLARVGTLEGLVNHWQTERYRRLRDVGEPPDGTVEGWLREACQEV